MADPRGSWWNRRLSPVVGDGMLAGFVTMVALVGSYGESYPTQTSDAAGLGSSIPHVPLAEFLLVIASGVALAWRRRFPETVWAVSLVAVLTGSSAAGLRITVEVRGAPHPLPPTVDLAAYRIVQESLTNALRHARPADAAVVLTYSDGVLDVDVSDTGYGPPVPESDEHSGGDAHRANGAHSGQDAQGGHGLEGMAERAAALGGVVGTGRADSGGFRVHARLPIGATP